MSCNFETMWSDDEFATANTVIDECKKKALEARADLIKQAAEEYNAYYSAYCD